MSAGAPPVLFAPLKLRRELPLVLSLAAAAMAALFVTLHWSIATVAALAILVLSATENEAFLLLTIFLIPVSWVLRPNLPVRDVATTMRLLVAAGFFVGRLWRGPRGTKQLLKSPVTWASLFVAGAALASTLLGTEGWTHESARTLIRLGSYVGFYLLIVAWVNSDSRLQKVLLTLLASTILVAAFAIFQEIVGGYTAPWLYMNPPDEAFVPWGNRAPSFLNYSNSLAAYLDLILPFALACSLTGAKMWRRVGAWTLFLGVVALACTQSRGGLVGFSCVAILAVFQFVQRWRKRVLLVAGLIVLALGFYAVGRVLNPEHLGEIEETTAVSRLFFWSTAWDLFLGSPLYGIGIGNFEVLYGDYIHLSWIPPGQYGVHNLYLQLLSETGLLGFVAFFTLLFLALREARRQLRCSSDFLSQVLGFGVLGAVLAMLVHGFVDFVMEASPQFGTLFWALLALLAVNCRLSGRALPGSTDFAQDYAVHEGAAGGVLPGTGIPRPGSWECSK